jgi:hypothetical protein
MSIEQLNLAFKADIQKAATKFVLVALADYANEAGEAYPTVETITAKTSLNRKTIISALKELSLLGFITDTGMVRGKTGQVKVWKLQLKATPERVPKTGRLSKPRKQPVKESQKRNSTENGTVPFSPPNDPKNGTVKESQKRDTEPSVLLTTIEPPVKERAPEKKSTPPTETEIKAKRVADYLHKKLIEEIPEAKSEKPNLWVKDIDRAIRIDGRTETELLAVIDWMHTGDKFWVGNIQSGKKLREKYLKMLAQMRRPKSNNSKPTRRPGEFDYQREVPGERLS